MVSRCNYRQSAAWIDRRQRLHSRSTTSRRQVRRRFNRYLRVPRYALHALRGVDRPLAPRLGVALHAPRDCSMLSMMCALCAPRFTRRGELRIRSSPYVLSTSYKTFLALRDASLAHQHACVLCAQEQELDGSILSSATSIPAPSPPIEVWMPSMTAKRGKATNFELATTPPKRYSFSSLAPSASRTLDEMNSSALAAGQMRVNTAPIVQTSTTVHRTVENVHSNVSSDCMEREVKLPVPPGFVFP